MKHILTLAIILISFTTLFAQEGEKENQHRPKTYRKLERRRKRQTIRRGRKTLGTTPF